MERVSGVDRRDVLGENLRRWKPLLDKRGRLVAECHAALPDDNLVLCRIREGVQACGEHRNAGLLGLLEFRLNRRGLDRADKDRIDLVGDQRVQARIPTLGRGLTVDDDRLPAERLHGRLLIIGEPLEDLRGERVTDDPDRAVADRDGARGRSGWRRGYGRRRRARR